MSENSFTEFNRELQVQIARSFGVPYELLSADMSRARRSYLLYQTAEYERQMLHARMLVENIHRRVLERFLIRYRGPHTGDMRQMLDDMERASR